MNNKKETSPIPNLTDFVEKYIPTKLPTNWHHKLYYDILENNIVMKEDGKLYENTENKTNKNILMLAPRFHAKSQSITINYPLWEMYRNPNVRILIVSANEEIAVSFNRAIMNHLENNHELIEDHGSLVPQFQNKKKWGEKAIIVKRDTFEKDPTVAAIGLGGRLISRRADIIICDDLIDIETARTKSQRQKTIDWFENVLLPILEDSGRLIIAGTAWYKGDIYDNLWADSGFDIRLKLKALIYHEGYQREGKRTETRFIPYRLRDYPQAQKAQDIMSDEVIHRYRLYQNLKRGVLWEDKWSYQKLMDKKKNMSNSSFMRQYLNEPTSEEEKVFKERYLREALDRGAAKTLQPTYDNTGNNKFDYGHLIIAEGVDLAISKKSTSDNTAIAIWGLNSKRDRILLYLDYGKWSAEEMKQKIVELYYNFKPAKIRVENVAFQEVIRQQLADDDIPVEGFHTTAGKKFNEETGIAHMAMMFEQGKVIIPSGQQDKEYFNRVQQLMYELSAYSYDQHAGDVLMASWFAFEALREFDKKLRDNRGFFKTEALVEQLKKVKAAHRIVILGYNPPYYKFSFNSLVYIFRNVDHPDIGGVAFFEPNEPFYIFATREEKSIAYIFQKQTSEIVGKIEGDLSALMFANLLEKAGFLFNKAQIVIDRNNEGEAIYMELQKRMYPKLLAMQPDEKGRPTIKDGFKISESNLPLSVDYFKQMVDSSSVDIRDEQLVKEMGELISVEKDRLNLSFGNGQRIKTVATALWLLDNYDTREKLLQRSPKIKKRKKLSLPYKVFNY